MPEAFSFNREFDFVRMDGLRRMTGRPAHEWDFYIIKELIDNALDADEEIWRKDVEQYPKLKIRVEYAANQLFVEVSNRSIFPASLIPQIFVTQQYTSRKAFIKSMTRGALGNALKTLLGIPYVLRNRVANDWSPDQKPLVIICAGKEYLPIYRIDMIEQNITFEFSEQPHKQTDGTTIKISLEYFEQEKPRTFTGIRQFAEQYHLSNPSVEFHWDIEIGEKDWSMNYAANPNWVSKFRGVAPVQWYSLTAFQDLLGALYREKGNHEEKGELSIELIGSYFANFSNDSGNRSNLIAKLLEQFGQSTIHLGAFEGIDAKKLYRLMCNLSPVFDSLQLGRIGKEHVRRTLAEITLPDVEMFYDIAQDTGEDSSVPFVIETAIVPLSEGSREIWTAINFAPTYDDPFMRRRLTALIQPDKTVIGLRELLDVYGIDEETPAVVFFHLICPSVESGEFSKTEINHLPFKRVIGEVIDRLLRAFNQARDEKELQLEQTIFQVLDRILDALKGSERFVFDQLLEKLRTKLSQEPSFAEWLQAPDASARLQIYISNYQIQNTVLTQRIARSSEGIIVIPGHPDRYFSIQAEHISQEILTQNHVNKILFVQVPELEPVIVENGWLCRMDMALLRNSLRKDVLQEALIQCVINSNIPILILRDGDNQGLAMFEQMREWLREKHLNENRIIDLGLASDSGEFPTKLVGMMPDELARQMLNRIKILNIPAKFIPITTDIRHEIGQKFEQLLLSYLWEGMSQRLAMPSFLNELDRHFQFTETMRVQTLDEQIQARLQDINDTQSYRVVLDLVLGEFFDRFLGQHGSEIQDLTHSHLQILSGERVDD
jgi:hypothetical protein